MVAQLDRRYVRYNPSVIWPRILSYALFEGRPLTTRGQWLNPLVLMGYHLWSRWPDGRAPHAPIILCGQGRSGTTLLGRALGLHPDVAFLNEPKALWHFAVGNDDVIGSFSDHPGKFSKSAREATVARRKRVHRIYRSIATITRRSRIAEKYPEQLFRGAFLNALFPDMRCVVLLRNPYQVAQSIARWSANNRAGQTDWWGKNGRKWTLLCDHVLRKDPDLRKIHARLGSFTRQQDRAALEWLACARHAMRLATEHPSQVLIVSFEALCDQPVMSLRSIMTFCGLRQDDRVLAFAKNHIAAPKDYDPPEIDPEIRALIAKTLPEFERLQLNPKSPIRHVA